MCVCIYQYVLLNNPICIWNAWWIRFPSTTQLLFMAVLNHFQTSIFWFYISLYKLCNRWICATLLLLGMSGKNSASAFQRFENSWSGIITNCPNSYLCNLHYITVICVHNILQILISLKLPVNPRIMREYCCRCCVCSGVKNSTSRRKHFSSIPGRWVNRSEATRRVKLLINQDFREGK